ncbi:ATP-binding cassette domain-containing protein [Curtobacterium sp. MCLR17_032]|uniref:ABC transporter ATP-binding protein n=1 Tax=Curtobacterium sp. MCLR17_032 TaxID=2175650 RepID=UPI0015E8C589|nr:ATP-binding cassette domain-containing protein [Curtobacterium sp. MCLR17_032]WIE62765.1 ATP-binding cassette domain-containing protein [Curtobacterium sp. MCLR17_032]
MKEQAVLRASGLGHDISSRTLWNELTITAEPSAAIAVRGLSGQGKTTLLRCLGGLERPTRGSVHVLGTDIHAAGSPQQRRLRRDVIGFVMQDHAVVPEWSVEQNLRVVNPRGLTRRELDLRIAAALEVIGLGGQQRTRAGLLSGGEQQRVAVARVLVQQPRVVLADEPTASLDDVSAGRVRDGLDLIRQCGGAVVVATHDPELLAWCEAEVDLSATHPSNRCS